MSKKGLPKKGNTTPSNIDQDTVAMIAAIGSLVTGQTNIDDSKKLLGQTKSKGTPKPENTGLLGLLSKMTNSMDVIVGGNDKSFFKDYWKTAKENQDYLKENVFTTENKEKLFKKLPDLLSHIDKNLGSVIETMNEPPSDVPDEKIDVEVSGGGDFEKLLNAFKNFDMGDNNKEALEELSVMTKKDGALSSIFENVDRLVDIDPDFEDFASQIDKMGDASTKAIAVGDDMDKSALKTALENLGEIAKVILALCAVGLILIVVGLLAQYIDFAGILKFTGILLLFLLGITAVFILASNYMQSGSGVTEGIKAYIALVAVSAVILIVGAMMNKFIPWKDVLGFVFKLGFFLLVLTGIFVLWNKVKAGVGSGLKDAIIAVGLAAFIMFLGAAAFKVLAVGALLKFLFFLGVFLFGIVIVLLATQLALRLGGGNDPSKPLREALLLVVGAAFIMFLGAACYKLLGPAAIIGFITLFDIFLGGLIAILMPLILVGGIFNKGAEVLRSVAVFVAVAAAVMLIGGGLIAFFPQLILTIPIFTVLLDLFIVGLTAVVTPLIIVSGIFTKAKETMEEISRLVAISAAVMVAGGGLIALFPDLIWSIPIFIVLMDLMIGSITLMMVMLIKRIKFWDAIKACLILRQVQKAVKGVAIAFLILSVAAAIISKYGGHSAFAILVTSMVATLTILLGMMVLVAKMIDERKAALAISILNTVVAAVTITSLAFGVLAIVYGHVMKCGGIGKFAALVAMLVGVLAVLSLGIVGLAYALGNPMTAFFAMIAIGVVLAAASAFAIVAAALLAISVSLKILSSIKSFDMTPLVKGVASLTLLTAALMPLALAAPFIMAASVALGMLTMVISKMANAVKEYADLKIGIYEGTKLVGYRHLDKKDFKNAATNVSLIITTLTKGVMQAYEEHPEWYGATGLFSLIGNMMNGGQTPLERVIRQSKLLAPLISVIADAVKDYADLKIKIYEGTKHVGYRQLKKKDFKNAATNVALVITTLTQGIMDVYEEHPDWYGISGLKSLFSSFFNDGKTPLERVIAHNRMLAPLISKIGEAIEEIANLKFANKWNEKGEAISYKLMKPKDFQKASDNIVKVITVMSEGIMKVYEEHPDWYGTGGTSIGGFFASLITNAFNDGTPMERVIAHDIKLARLISKVADGIKDYAELKVPTEWDKEGKVIGYRNIKDKDFEAAGENIVRVMTTLSYGLMEVYEQHPEWYENSGFFGTGDTPMEKVIKTDTKLSKLISTVAAAVKDYAQLRIPIEWDKESGKAINFREMEAKDFISAGQNIGLVVTSAALGLMGYYSDGTPTPSQPFIEKYMMKDEDDADEEFERLIDNSQKIGTIISGMADGISKYAKMLVPDQWDPKTGTAIHYVMMDDTMMKQAGEGIGAIITCVAESLISVYENNKAMFGWNAEDEEFEDDSPIQHVIDSCVNMGSVISGIADGITKFAEMKMPTEWDKSGKPIKFEKIGKQVFTQAADNIGEILTLLGGTMMGIYEANPEMFTIRTKHEGGIFGIGGSDVPVDDMTPFERVTEASVQMATVVGSIAQALQIFADKKVIGKNEEVIAITDETISLAKKSITNILITLAHTFKYLATGPTKDLFTPDVMEMIVEPVGQMTAVVGTMAKSIQDLAMLKVPIKWGNNGEPTDFRQMNTGDFLQASINIQLILSAIGNAFMEIASDPRNTWISNASKHKSETTKFLGVSFFEKTADESSEGSGDGITEVLEGMSTLATILSIISGCIYGYATMRFPMGTDKDGKVQYSDPITPRQMMDAKYNIQNVASTLAEAMYWIVKDYYVEWLSSEEGSEKMEDTSSAFDTMISSITSMIEGVKGLTEHEAAKALNKVSTDLGKLIVPLTSIINDISAILALLFKGDNEKYGTEEFTFGGHTISVSYSFAELMKKYQPMFDATGNNFEEFINSIIKIIEAISSMNKPLSDSYVKISSLYNLFEQENYVDKIHTIIGSIGQLLHDMKAISNFDNILIGEDNTLSGYMESGLDFLFSSQEEINAENKTKAMNEVADIIEKLAIYSSLILNVVSTLQRVNSSISDLQMANYAEFNMCILGFFNAIRLVKLSIGDMSRDQAENIAAVIISYSQALNILIDTAARTASLGDANFEVLTKGIIDINESLSHINAKGLLMFKVQTNQLEKFVKTVNSIKLLNITNLNKFVTSLNQLANKMGNLDRLTEAIANKLSKVLEKLVERLAHAEQTIVKADEIQKRRHELIKKSVEEVSNLMKQPMTVEVQQMGGGTAENTPTDNNSGNTQQTTT